MFKLSVAESSRDHVLKRPDMYVGANHIVQQTQYVAEEKITTRSIVYNPAFFRCVVEIGSNAVDNAIRSKTTPNPCTYIKFSISEDGILVLENDGNTIPIEKSGLKNFQEEYNPSIVFGVFMSSTNYDDEVDRFTSGRNGFGAKLTNTFSTQFEVEICDGTKRFSQLWENNMEIVNPPVISSSRGKTYTKITWIPDYLRFGMDSLSDDLIAKLRKYMFDVAMYTGVNVYFNGELIRITSLLDYAKMYYKSPPVMHAFQTDTCDVVIADHPFPGQISFVNGIPTHGNGVHVDLWKDAISKPIQALLNQGGDTIRPGDIYNNLSFFVSSTLNKPSFDGQNKDKLAAPKPARPSIEDTVLLKMSKWSSIQKMLKDRELKRAKKKVEEITKQRAPTSYDRANILGPNSNLLYCEGESAKTYIVHGLDQGVGGKKGRDYNGILACRGKILNVRKKPLDQILENQEIAKLIQVMGLQFDVDYSIDANYRKLKYGTFYIVTDADDDGIHIKGLIMNFFDYLFPSLLQRPGFLRSLCTPTVIVGPTLYYSHLSYKNSANTGKAKYYKGLGSYEEHQIKELFNKKVIIYNPEESEAAIQKAFDPSLADKRKEWIMQFKPEDIHTYLDHPHPLLEVGIDMFIDNELVCFSRSSTERAIPNIMDGLKQSQRKILYTALTRKNETVKINILANQTSAKTMYIHGEKNLADTITGMTWSFPGSNNLPLFQAKGSTGSRNKNGKDAADPRYTYTLLHSYVPHLFKREDNEILQYVVSENVQVEPEFYLPILPTILINGAVGIATGWSTYIPCYKYTDVVQNVQSWLEDGSFYTMHPHYEGFKGRIEQVHDTSYRTYGVCEIGPSSVTVTEIPIGMSIDDFKERLEDLLEEKKIKKYRNNSTNYAAHFVIEGIQDLEEFIQKNLISSISTNNMIAFDEHGVIRKYNTIYDLLETWCSVRLRWYQTRKEYLMDTLEKDLCVLTNKHRFISSIVDGSLTLLKKKREEMVREISAQEYDMVEGSYKYLLNIPLGKMSEEEIQELELQMQQRTEELAHLRQMDVREMWLQDLSKVKV